MKGQQVYEKMSNIINYKGNSNQNYNELSLTSVRTISKGFLPLGKIRIIT